MIICSDLTNISKLILEDVGVVDTISGFDGDHENDEIKTESSAIPPSTPPPFLSPRLLVSVNNLKCQNQSNRI